jgi:hypothetical protein
MTHEPVKSTCVSTGMNKITVAIGLIAALALPATAAAKPQPDQANKKAAQTQCKSERGSTQATHEAFKAKYHSMSRCVRQNAVEEATEEQQAHTNASKECATERDSLGQEAFAEKYGTNGNKRNAFGKCVSGKARESKAELDAQDAQEVAAFKNAAKECAAERESLGVEAFRAKYGTNANKRNAFGKCVSGKAKEDEEAAPTA